jgi:hypothetical protein
MASLHSSFSRMLEEPLDGRDKVPHLEWLALKGVEPGVRNLLPVGGHHRRGHRHDENLSSRFLGSQPSERLDPVDPRESNVNQDQARMSLLGEISVEDGWRSLAERHDAHQRPGLDKHRNAGPATRYSMTWSARSSTDCGIVPVLDNDVLALGVLGGHSNPASRGHLKIGQ